MNTKYTQAEKSLFLFPYILKEIFRGISFKVWGEITLQFTGVSTVSWPLESEIQCSTIQVWPMSGDIRLLKILK